MVGGEGVKDDGVDAAVVVVVDNELDDVISVAADDVVAEVAVAEVVVGAVVAAAAAAHQMRDFTCPLDFKMMSTTARSKKFVRS